MSSFYKCIIFAFFFSVATPALHQNKSLDKESWENTVDGENFFERRGEVKPVESNKSNSSLDFDDLKSGEKPKKADDDIESKRSSGSFNFSIPSWVSYTLMIIIIGLLVYFIVFTILRNSSNKVKTGVTSLSEDDIKYIEENLFDNNLEQYIHEAKMAEDYKLAIRFSFIYIIRLLDENGIIKWRKQKTNYQYLTELEGNPFRDSFSLCKIIFENLWYGSSSFSDSLLIQTLELYASHISKLKAEAAN